MGTTARTLLFRAILLAGIAPALAFPALAFDGGPQKGAPAQKGAAKQTPAAPGAAANKPADAQAQDEAKDKSKAAENAARMLDAGLKAYQAGDTKQAVRAFDAVLQGGLINHQQMAQALYYRGLCRRKENKPGLAISDLTAAIWLKDGLTPGEKQEAMRHRVAAYQEAGIGDVPDFTPPDAGGTGAPISGAATATASTGAAPATGGSAWQTASTGSSAAPAPAPAPSSGSSGGGFFSSITNFFTGGSSSSSAPAPAPAPAPAANTGDVTTASLAEPPRAAPAVASGWSQSVDVSSNAAAPAAPAAPAASEPLPWSKSAPQQVAAPAAPPPQGDALPWASTKSSGAPAANAPAPAPVAATTPAAATPVAAAEPVPAPHATYRPLTGKYQVQVGAVRSREEADLMVARLLTEHGGDLGGRDPKVDQAAIGNMGTFYRVRVGPYANATDSKELCSALRSSGFDCLVVTN